MNIRLTAKKHLDSFELLAKEKAYKCAPSVFLNTVVPGDGQQTMLLLNLKSEFLKLRPFLHVLKVEERMLSFKKQSFNFKKATENFS